jgi:hypothetical protein
VLRDFLREGSRPSALIIGVPAGEFAAVEEGDPLRTPIMTGSSEVVVAFIPVVAKLRIGWIILVRSEAENRTIWWDMIACRRSIMPVAASAGVAGRIGANGCPCLSARLQ